MNRITRKWKRFIMFGLIFALALPPWIGSSSKTYAAALGGIDSSGRVIVEYGSPKVDGEIDSVWENVYEVVPNIASAPTSTSATFKTLWDDNALYVLAEVTDSNLNASNGAAYQQDSVELFLNEWNDSSVLYQSDDVHYRVNYNNERSADNGEATRFYTKTKRTADGYLVEARIALTMPPANGQEMGFEWQVNEADGSGTRKATLNVFDRTGNAYANPSLMGKIVLSGKPDGAVTGLNPYNLLSYLEYAKTIDKSVFINGGLLTAPIAAGDAVAANDSATQAELDQALSNLTAAVAELRRSEKYGEPRTLPVVPGLPDPFTFQDGSKVSNSADWTRRSAELKDMYQFYMYGYMPDVSKETVTYEKTANGLNITVQAGGKSATFPVTVDLPSGNNPIAGPYPVIVTYGSLGFPPADPNSPTPLLSYTQQANNRGYAVVTVNTATIASDNANRTGAFFDLYPYSKVDSDVGVLMAWSWGAGKVMDVLGQRAYPEIDPAKSVITGFSRWGKAALVTGAFDSRFAIVNPQNSGAGGMASYRASFTGKQYAWEVAGATEGLGSLQSNAEAHWFSSVFSDFRDPNTIPVDQHELAALVAPRGLLVTAGYSDWWTNPEGMYVSYAGASKVYDFLGAGDKLGVAFRPGGHIRPQEDLDNLLAFSDKQFRGIAPTGHDFQSTLYNGFDPAWDTIMNPKRGGADSSGRIIVPYGSPTVDGQVDSIWDKVNGVTPSIASASTSTSATFKTLWDDNAIYVLAVVKDANLNASNGAAYQQDSVELFMNELNDASVIYGNDDVHYRVNYNNVRTADNGELTRFYTKASPTGDGYIVEARIALTQTPSNGQEMGFEWQVNEADGSGMRKATLNVFDRTGNAYANPSLMGKIVLSGKEEDAVTGLNPYDLLAYLEYAKSIEQPVYLNGGSLNAPIEAAVNTAANANSTQAQIDQAYTDLKRAVKLLRRSAKFDEPQTLPANPKLPDPFTFENGSKVKTASDWAKRSEELKDMYQFYMYGYMPDKSKETVTYEKTATGLTIKVKVGDKTASFPVTVNLPSSDNPIKGPYPVIVSYGSLGTPPADPNAGGPLRSYTQQANDRGYAVITVNTATIASDNANRTGAFFDLYPYSRTSASSDTGVLMAWSWGAGKVLDVLGQQAYAEIDPAKSVITGFSRWGKAALVTGAFDSRFAIVNPQNSGAGGMASYRASFTGKQYAWEVAGATEGLGSLQSNAEAHWFSSVFSDFRDPNTIPVDQHELAALVAPRGLLVTAGYSDWWTNPEGMFVSYLGASKVYDFLGAADKIGVAFRPGGHIRPQEDLDNLLAFSDKQFRGITAEGYNFQSTLYSADPAWDTIKKPEQGSSGGDGTSGGGGYIPPINGNSGSPDAEHPYKAAVETDANGAAIVKVALDDKALEQFLTAAKKGSVLPIDITDSGKVIETSVTAAQLAAITGSVEGLQLQISSKLGGFVIPADTLKQSIAALGDNFKNGMISIQLSAASIQGAASSDAIELVGGPAEFKIVVAGADGKKAELQTMNGYVGHVITVNAGTGSGDPADWSGAVFLPASGQFYPVPTVIQQSGSQVTATLYRAGNSVYTLMNNRITFPDVSATDYGKEAIETLASRLVVNGYTDGTFKPGNRITRAEFVTMLLKGLGIVPEAQAGAQASFSDVQGTDWYSEEVAAAVSHQFVQGYEDGTFRPMNPITRQEMTVILVNVLRQFGIAPALSDEQAAEILGAFRDADAIPQWARASTAISVQQHIMQGVKDDLLSLAAPVDRRQGAVLLLRMLDQIDWSKV